MNQQSPTFDIVCECCGAKITVDPKTRSIFAVEKEGKKERSFQDVVKDVTSVGDRAQKKFEETLEQEKAENKGAALDALFEQAKKKARENPNEKPPSIWDYD